MMPKTIEFHCTLPSTSDRVAELLKKPILPALPCLVLAQRQTAGRGRDGKSWWSGSGSLLMSLGLDAQTLGMTRDNFPELSVLTAQALIETLRPRLSKKHEIALHCPNDVYVDGKKISGILLESPLPRFVIVGVGVNVNNSLQNIPMETPRELQEELEKRQITSLIDLLGRKTSIPALVAEFLVRFGEMIKMR